jgi:hypothetical protein
MCRTAEGQPGSCQLDPNNPPATLTLPESGICPPGYHRVYHLEFPQVDYCELNPTPTPPYETFDSGIPEAKPILGTVTPQAQAPNSGVPDPKPALEIVQYCANKGADLGGANITYPSESTLHIDDWSSQSPGHVQCVDDLSNPRTCWGPESEAFEVLLCNTDMVQNQDYACKSRR